MDKLVRVRHGGNLLRTVSGNVEFEEMSELVFMFGRPPSFNDLFERVESSLSSSEEVTVLKIDGVIDVGSANGPRVKRIAPIRSESDWEAYKDIVMSSEVRSLDLIVMREFAETEGATNVFEITNEPSSGDVGPQEEVPVSQEKLVPTQGTDCGEDGANESLGRWNGPVEVLLPSNNEYEGGEGYNENAGHYERDSGNEHEAKGDGRAMASDWVDVQVEGDDESYDDEMASDSDDDRPVPRLSARDMEILKEVMRWRDPLVPDYFDLSQGHRAVADGRSEVPISTNSSCDA
ncbi:hypothetical protein BS78_04G084300 [Paspalum vaginatum]|nr:hypothetical protein BS78_04G084300 [Paspalum vaginatum]